MPIAEGAQGAEESRRCGNHAAFALDRLDEDPGDVIGTLGKSRVDRREVTEGQKLDRRQGCNGSRYVGLAVSASAPRVRPWKPPAKAISRCLRPPWI